MKEQDLQVTFIIYLTFPLPTGLALAKGVREGV